MYELGFYIPEGGILHGHRRENFKSYLKATAFLLFVYNIQRITPTPRLPPKILQPTSRIRNLYSAINSGLPDNTKTHTWTLSIVRISTNRKHNVSETGSISVFRSGGGGHLLYRKTKNLPFHR
jgi:hypothetical protein